MHKSILRENYLWLHIFTMNEDLKKNNLAGVGIKPKNITTKFLIS